MQQANKALAFAQRKTCPRSAHRQHGEAGAAAHAHFCRHAPTRWPPPPPTHTHHLMPRTPVSCRPHPPVFMHTTGQPTKRLTVTPDAILLYIETRSPVQSSPNNLIQPHHHHRLHHSVTIVTAPPPNNPIQLCHAPHPPAAVSAESVASAHASSSFHSIFSNCTSVSLLRPRLYVFSQSSSSLSRSYSTGSGSRAPPTPEAKVCNNKSGRAATHTQPFVTLHTSAILYRVRLARTTDTCLRRVHAGHVHT